MKRMPPSLPALRQTLIPTNLQEADSTRLRPVRRGRPRQEPRKVATTIRLDADIIEHFRGAGAGWQSRINAALRKVAGL
jgi:uncharacterized protein (DUF4415 family)